MLSLSLSLPVVKYQIRYSCFSRNLLRRGGHLHNYTISKVFPCRCVTRLLKVYKRDNLGCLINCTSIVGSVISSRFLSPKVSFRCDVLVAAGRASNYK